MATLQQFIARRSLLSYFVLTFAISWGGVLMVTGPGGPPSTKADLDAVVPLAIAVMLAGPAVSSILLTAIIDGRAGLLELISRLCLWRVGVRWYLIAILVAPLVTAALLFALSAFSPVFLPGVIAVDDKSGRVLFGLAAGLAAGVLEELGWTGFALPRLRRRHTILGAGLVIGVLWGGWHAIAQGVFAGPAYAGTLPVGWFMTARIAGLLVGGLPAFRVLMAWVYDETGSLPVAMLMHVSLTATTLTLEPVGISGAALLVCDVVSIGTWWALVVAVAAATRGRFLRRPLQAQIA